MEEIEKKLGRKLPQEYKEYVKERGGKFYEGDAVFKSIEITPLAEEDGKGEILNIYSEDELKIQIRNNAEVIPNKMLPIGDSHGGDVMCIDIETGKVYYWSHDWEYEDGSNEGLYLVQNSFKEFLDNLEVEEYGGKDVRSTVGVEIWLSDELKD